MTGCSACRADRCRARTDEPCVCTRATVSEAVGMFAIALLDLLSLIALEAGRGAAGGDAVAATVGGRVARCG